VRPSGKLALRFSHGLRRDEQTLLLAAILRLAEAHRYGM
jgi:hypothetical protein